MMVYFQNLGESLLNLTERRFDEEEEEMNDFENWHEAFSLIWYCLFGPRIIEMFI